MINIVHIYAKQCEIMQKNQYPNIPRVRNNTFEVSKVINSELTPARWVSDTQDVSLLM